MSHIKKISIVPIASLLVAAGFLFTSVVTSQRVVAVDEDTCIKTAFQFNGTNCLPKNKDATTVAENPIWKMLIDFMKVVSGLVGVAVAAGVIYGGILWSTASGNEGQTRKAITVISNAILGLLMYIMMFAIINFLVPGGLFV